MVLCCGVLFSGVTLYGGEEEVNLKDLPPRGISVSPEFTGIIISEGDKISMDLIVANRGRQNEDILISFPTIPKGWKVWAQTYNYNITSLYLEGGKSKSLTLKAEPEKGIGHGEYRLEVKGETRDGKLRSGSELTFVVKEKKKEEKKAEGLTISTSYPVLEGPTDSKFEFSLDVDNKSDRDKVFNIAYEGPKDWDIRFKPAYEDKYITSLRIKGNLSQSMAVEVKPNPWAEPGNYPLLVKVSTQDAREEVKLTVVLKGTYKMEAGTADGLLSLNAYQGKEANLSFYVKNEGSAPQNNVRFLSFKPENWKVEFTPETIDVLPPGEMQQVEMKIIPAEQALVGDYSVNLSIEGEKVSKNLEFRVTVRASTAWGWIGIGVILFVILGLVVLFIKLGRR
jgi:uncharacterized membrane protein